MYVVLSMESSFFGQGQKFYLVEKLMHIHMHPIEGLHVAELPPNFTDRLEVEKFGPQNRRWCALCFLTFSWRPYTFSSSKRVSICLIDSAPASLTSLVNSPPIWAPTRCVRWNSAVETGCPSTLLSWITRFGIEVGNSFDWKCEGRMAGALSVVGSSIFDPKACPCLCLDAAPSSNMSVKAGNGDLVWQRNSFRRKRLSRRGTMEMGSSFVDSWNGWRLEAKLLSSIVNRSSRRRHKARRLLVVSELAGQYEDSFEDVKTVRKWVRIVGFWFFLICFLWILCKNCCRFSFFRCWCFHVFIFWSNVVIFSISWEASHYASLKIRHGCSD